MKHMSHEELVTYTAMVKRLEDYAKANRDRDQLIREAYAAGVSKTEIAKRMEISRTTVLAVLGGQEK